MVANDDDDADDADEECDDGNAKQAGSGIVRIAHFSVQEYLSSERIQSGRGGVFALLEPEEHARIAKACLLYLTYDDFLHQTYDEDLVKQFAFARYAARYWHHHCRRTQGRHAEFLLPKIAGFLGTPLTRERWLKLYNPESLYHTKMGDVHPSAIYYASLLGLDEFMAFQLPKSLDELNSPQGVYGSALQAASACDNQKIVEMLLDKGADVNTRAGLFGTSLYLASERGHETLVQMLLDRGADPNIRGESQATALFVASRRRSATIVQMLLGRGADVNAHNSELGTALHVGTNSREAVQMLLDRGADVNAFGGIHGTATAAASTSGRHDVLRILLDAGANVNAQGGEFGGALQTASFSSGEEAVQMLLNAGADINARGGIFGTALVAASGNYDVQLVRTLLKAGVKVNDRCIYGHTALIQAVISSSSEIAWLLLESKADPSIVDVYGRTAADWLKLRDTDADLLQRICDIAESPASKDVKTLRDSVASLSAMIMECKRIFDWHLYNVLGHCLLMLGDRENAQIASEKNNALYTSTSLVHKKSFCDACSDYIYGGTRYICTVCPNMDLCDKCIVTHREGQDQFLATCRDHEFWHFVSSGTARTDNDYMNGWLQAMVNQYSQPDSDSKAHEQ